MNKKSNLDKRSLITLQSNHLSFYLFQWHTNTVQIQRVVCFTKELTARVIVATLYYDASLTHSHTLLVCDTRHHIKFLWTGSLTNITHYIRFSTLYRHSILGGYMFYPSMFFKSVDHSCSILQKMKSSCA